MSKISRRKFVTAGLAATASVSGLAVAANLAKRYRLIPPDSSGIYGPGETLTFAAHRLFARHSLAREFPRSMISKVPFPNEIPPLNDEFKRFQTGGFADWRFSIDGMVA
jgi:DMSO/TMAO reductase YedYZ molybdopterin-dependent catalytic subunit